MQDIGHWVLMGARSKNVILRPSLAVPEPNSEPFFIQRFFGEVTWQRRPRCRKITFFRRGCSWDMYGPDCQVWTSELQPGSRRTSCRRSRSNGRFFDEYFFIDYFFIKLISTGVSHTHRKNCQPSSKKKTKLNLVNSTALITADCTDLPTTHPP